MNPVFLEKIISCPFTNTGFTEILSAPKEVCCKQIVDYWIMKWNVATKRKTCNWRNKFVKNTIKHISADCIVVTIILYGQVNIEVFDQIIFVYDCFKN